MKLSNGDEIICKLHNTENGYFKVGYPMKMCTVNTMGKDGKYEENLALLSGLHLLKIKYLQ
tara:strand:+ start:680 stop:862 length:183 start_codon:yes stop_codon:yes gene_type:complete